MKAPTENVYIGKAKKCTLMITSVVRTARKRGVREYQWPTNHKQPTIVTGVSHVTSDQFRTMDLGMVRVLSGWTETLSQVFRALDDDSKRSFKSFMDSFMSSNKPAGKTTSSSDQQSCQGWSAGDHLILYNPRTYGRGSKSLVYIYFTLLV